MWCKPRKPLLFKGICQNNELQDQHRLHTVLAHIHTHGGNIQSKRAVVFILVFSHITRFCTQSMACTTSWLVRVMVRAVFWFNGISNSSEQNVFVLSWFDCRDLFVCSYYYYGFIMLMYSSIQLEINHTARLESYLILISMLCEN